VGRGQRWVAREDGKCVVTLGELEGGKEAGMGREWGGSGEDGKNVVTLGELGGKRRE